jgi:hypothetical protein
MSTLALPPACDALALFTPERVATHVVRFQVKRQYKGGHEYDLLGSMVVDVANNRDAHRVTHLLNRLRYRLQGMEVITVHVDLRTTTERRELGSLGRFRRKMGMVLRTYEEEKAKALRGELGFTELALERLDVELQACWVKAREIYGHTKEEFTNEQPLN